MSNLLRTGASWLAGRLSDAAADTVTYRRGSRSVSLAATKGSPQSELDTQFGVLQIVGTPWFIKASLLVLGGETVTPQKNDEIEESNGAKWQVLSTISEQEARESDPFGYSWRIDTKRTEAPS